MKQTSSLLCAAILAAGAGAAFGQQALKTDTSGNPLTPLNLSGSNVTGTLPSGRLPAGAGAPVVQMISAHSGSVTLAAGTTAAILTGTLDGTLTLVLPAASSFPVGRALLVVDPGGFSSTAHPVYVTAASGNTLAGGSAPVLALSGAGAAAWLTNGTAAWTGDGREQQARKDQANGYAGLDATGSLNLAGDLLIHDLLAADADGLYVQNERVIGTQGDVYAQGVQWFDGDGNLTLTGIHGAGALFNPDHLDHPIISNRGELTSLGVMTLLPCDPGDIITPTSGVVHYVSNSDGKEYVRDSDGYDHALW